MWAYYSRAAFFAVGLVLFESSVAHAEDSLVHWVRKSKNSIRGLKWNGEGVTLEPRWQGQELKVFAILDGVYLKPEWSLLSHLKKIEISPKGRFRIAVPISGKTTPVALIAIGVKGEVESEQIEIAVPTYD